jgi:hypothetical protein
MRTAGRSVAVLAAAAVFGASAFTAPAVEPISPRINFPERRWSVLEDYLLSVVEGPDGRLWRQVEAAGPRFLEPDPRRQIEAAFATQSPYVIPWKLVLLDSSGRAWFNDGENHFHGYDGRRWLEVPAGFDRDSYNNEGCATRGAFQNSLRPTSVGAVTFINSHRGIHRIEGERWTYHRIAENSELGGTNIAVSSDGRHAAAYFGRHPRFHYLDGEQWRISDELMPSNHNQINQLVVQNDGTVWLLDYLGRLRRFREGKDVTDDAPPKAIAALIERLGSSKFAEREAADESIRKLATIFDGELHEALRRTNDAEIRRRLGNILATGRGETIPHPSFTRFGPAIITGVVGLTADPSGTIYLAAPTIIDDRMQVRTGVIMLKPDGASRLLEGAELTEAFTGECEAVLAPDGKGAWMSRGIYKPIAYLDFDAGRFTDELPDARHWHVLAVDAEGRVLASVDPMFYFRRDTRVMAFDRRIPDARRRLENVTLPESTTAVMVSDDEILAGGDRCEMRYRFSTRQWTRVAEEEAESPAWRPKNLSFQDHYDADEPYFDFEQLDSSAYEGPLCSAHDRRGRRWFASPGFDTAQVLIRVEDRTISVAEELARQGEPAEKATLIGRLGDGSRMLLRVWKNEPYQQRLIIAEIDDGKLRFETLPRHLEISPAHMPWAVNDADGSLWLSSRNVSEHCLDKYELVELYSTRITPRGVAKEPSYSGWPWLRDRSGNVWFGPEPGSGGTFGIHRDGRLLQEIRFPQTDHVLKLLSTAPGSVYAFISGGLLHLKADGPGFTNYRPAEFYDVGPFPGTSLDAREIGDGWIAVATIPQGSPGFLSFHLIKLPNTDP